jgi:hypothetical protein
MSSMQLVLEQMGESISISSLLYLIVAFSVVGRPYHCNLRNFSQSQTYIYYYFNVYHYEDVWRTQTCLDNNQHIPLLPLLSSVL